jgi:hypothetical protein
MDLSLRPPIAAQDRSKRVVVSDGVIKRINPQFDSHLFHLFVAVVQMNVRADVALEPAHAVSQAGRQITQAAVNRLR